MWLNWARAPPLRWNRTTIASRYLRPQEPNFCACQDRSSCARSQPLFYLFSWSHVREGKKPESGVNCGVSWVRHPQEPVRHSHSGLNRRANPGSRYPDSAGTPLASLRASCVNWCWKISSLARLSLVTEDGRSDSRARFPLPRPERIPLPLSVPFRSRRSADPRQRSLWSRSACGRDQRQTTRATGECPAQSAW